MTRRMHLAAYLMSPGTHFAGLWRHPYSTVDFLDRTVYETLGRTLEQGCFDMIFIPEALALNDTFAGSHDAAVRHGLLNSVKPAPAQLAAVIAAATNRLGLGITASASYEAPYHLARNLGSLDHFSGGRVAWNIVMSADARAGENFGETSQLAHDQIYDRGDDVVEAVVGLWNSWEPNAIIADKARSLYADPGKVHQVDHKGPYASVRGPLSLPRSPQGQPVLIQAGTSPRGRRFAGRWADAVFAIERTGAALSELRAGVRQEAIAHGRDPDSVRLIAAVQPILGETQAIAEARRQYLESIIDPEAGIAMLSSFIRQDLSRFTGDEPIEALAAGGTDSSPARIIAALREIAEERALTVADAGRLFAVSELTPQLAGTAEQVADHLEELFLSGACDGFVFTPTHFPGTFDEIVRALVPELQRRGLVRTRYDGTTLREVMNLPDRADLASPGQR